MQEWIIAMLVVSALLILREMCIRDRFQGVLMAGGPHRPCHCRGSRGENRSDAEPVCGFL